MRLTRLLRTTLDGLFRRLDTDREQRLRRRLRRMRRPAYLGTARRTSPLSLRFGYDRGQPIDRYFIAAFLSEHRSAICGRVLEVKDDGYTAAYGVGVTQADVLDIDPTNDRATVVGDLARLDGVPDASFNCFILTQTLQLVYDVDAAVANAHRILKPGGALLATVPVVSKVTSVPGKFDDYWRFTRESCARLFGAHFVDPRITGYGNVLTSVAFLLGMASEELQQRELETTDPEFPTLIAIFAQK